jgi:hypothetical protein
MIYKLLNIGKEVDYWQGNNIYEIENPNGYDQCGVEAIASGRAAMLPLEETTTGQNEYGGDWRIQEGDYLASFFKEPRNWDEFRKIRLLNYDKWPPQQIPQLFPYGIKRVFGLNGRFVKSITFDMIYKEIKRGNAVILCIDKSNPLNPSSSGHFIMANQYDDMLDKISFKDPAKDVVKWKSETLDKDGNKWFNRRDFQSNIRKWFFVMHNPL